MGRNFSFFLATRKALKTEPLVRWWGVKHTQSHQSYGHTAGCKGSDVSTFPCAAAISTPFSPTLDGQAPRKQLTKCSRLTLSCFFPTCFFSGNIIPKVCPSFLLFSSWKKILHHLGEEFENDSISDKPAMKPGLGKPVVRAITAHFDQLFLMQDYCVKYPGAFILLRTSLVLAVRGDIYRSGWVFPVSRQYFTVETLEQKFMNFLTHSPCFWL